MMNSRWRKESLLLVKEGDELYEHWKVQVDANQDPVRIDKYLADKMAYQSRNRIQQAADAGFIHVNGKPVKTFAFMNL